MPGKGKPLTESRRKSHHSARITETAKSSQLMRKSCKTFNTQWSQQSNVCDMCSKLMRKVSTEVQKSRTECVQMIFAKILSRPKSLISRQRRFHWSWGSELWLWFLSHKDEPAYVYVCLYAANCSLEQSRLGWALINSDSDNTKAWRSHHTTPKSTFPILETRSYVLIFFHDHIFSPPVLISANEPRKSETFLLRYRLFKESLFSLN